MVMDGVFHMKSTQMHSEVGCQSGLLETNSTHRVLISPTADIFIQHRSRIVFDILNEIQIIIPILLSSLRRRLGKYIIKDIS